MTASLLAGVGDFHFLRPLWLLALLPAAFIALMAWRRLARGADPWAKLVDAHLLRHLAQTERAGRRRSMVVVLLAGWVIAILAVAGPAWQKLPTPTLERRDPVVVALSLARTMDTGDVSPTRLSAARHKIEDLLKRMQGGQVGLIIFADIPFVASPLTEDARVVGQMLPELATSLMPVNANRPDLAIARAVDLLKGADAPFGRIVLVADGAGDAPQRTRAAAAAAAQSGYAVNVIAASGAASGETAGTPLADVASAGGGAFAALSVDGSDLDLVLAGGGRGGVDMLARQGLSVDQWADMGPWLALLLLLMAPLAFRRGLIAAIAFALLAGSLPLGSGAQAQEVAGANAQAWRDLWRTPNQQGDAAFAAGDYQGAASRFQDPAWRASALYKAGDYAGAAAAFESIPGADYNRGNALARAGQLEEAVAAYDAALAAEPTHADAVYNRELVRRLIEKKKDEEKQKSGGGGQGGGQGGGGQGQGGKGGGKSDQGKADQSKSDQSKSDQSKSDQSKSDQAKSDQNKPQPDQSKSEGKGGGKEAERKPDPQPPKPQSAPPQPPNQKSANEQPPQPPQPNPGAGQSAQAPPPKPPEQKPPEQTPPANAPGQAGAPQPPAPPSPPKSPGQPGSAGAPPPAPPQDAAAALAARRAEAERDQTREQMLRLVPDDPSGLLRARIRSHYFGGSAAIAPVGRQP